MVRQVPVEITIGIVLTIMKVEVDPYKKPKELVELSPKGLVPALRLNSFNPPKALNESTIIMEYLEE
jgi:glutathione S-transferase